MERQTGIWLIIFIIITINTRQHTSREVVINTYNSLIKASNDSRNLIDQIYRNKETTSKQMWCHNTAIPNLNTIPYNTIPHHV